MSLAVNKINFYKTPCKIQNKLYSKPNQINGADSVCFTSNGPKPQKMFVFDLDGTFAEGSYLYVDKAMELKDQHNGLLVYATGRSFKNAKELFDQSRNLSLPTPDYVICDNGSEIYNFKDGEFQKDENWWPNVVERTNFDREQVLEYIKEFANTPKYLLDKEKDSKREKLKRIEPDFCRSKISYYEYSKTQNKVELLITPGLDDIENDIKAFLESKGIQSTSCKHCFSKEDVEKARRSVKAKSSARQDKEGDIEVLVVSATDKAGALEHLSEQKGIEKENIITAGNDGNDLCFIKKGFNFICVGNAEKFVKDFIENLSANLKKNVFVAIGNGAKGVYQGLINFLARKNEPAC